MHRSTENLARRMATTTTGAVAAVVVALVATVLPVTPVAAQTDAGVLSTFGANDTGQLGQAAGGSVSPVIRNLDVVDVEGGDGHSLAVTADGRVFAWGANGSGQAGRTPSLLGGSQAPAQVAGLPPVAQVAAGAKHSLALTRSGEVYAWGDNTLAQLSLSPTTLLLASTPTKVAGLPAGDPVVDIAAGDNHSVALTTSGAVFAWGSNSAGQAGTGGVLGVVKPDPLVIVPTATRQAIPASITSIGAGASHTLAVAGNGDVWGFGSNASGQLGGPDTANVTVARLIADVPSAASAVGSDAGTLILGRDGSVTLLGDGSGAPRAIAVPTATEVAAGGAHYLAVVDTSIADDPSTQANEAVARAEVWSFGSSSAGQTGHADPAPARALAADTVVAVGAGDRHSLVTRASRVTASPNLLSFPVTEIGVAAQSSVEVANAGPVPVAVGGITVDGSDFALGSGGTCGSTLAPSSSCRIPVTFVPGGIGARTGSLTIDHTGFGPSLVVPLVGRGTQVSGTISIISGDPAEIEEVPASPANIPLNAIPVQALSPSANDTQAAAKLPLGDISLIGKLPFGDISLIARLPLGDISLIAKLPFGDISLIGVKLPLGDISLIGVKLPLGDISSIGKLPFGDISLIAPRSAEVLASVSVADVVLSQPLSWIDAGGRAYDPADPGSGGGILNGTPLEDSALHDVSLRDVLEDAVAAERFAAVPTGNVNFALSPIGRMSLLAFMAGDVPVGSIPGACEGIERASASDDCGASVLGVTDEAAARAESPLEFHMAGIPNGAIDLSALTLSELFAAGDSPLSELILDLLPLQFGDLGSVRVADTDVEAVADCSQVDCETATLFEAQRAGALRPEAQLDDLGRAADALTVGGTVAGLFDPADFPFENFPLSDLGVGYWGGEGSSQVPYRVTFRNGDNELAPGSKLAVTLPTSFAYVARSASFAVDGGEPVPADAGGAPGSGVTTPDGFETLEFAIPDSVSVGPDQVLTLDFAAHPGLRLGVFSVDDVELRSPGGAVIGGDTTGQAPVRVIDPERAGGPGDDTIATATELVASNRATAEVGELQLGFIDRRTDTDVHRFEADAGSSVQLVLAHMTDCDADVFVYGASGMTGEAPARPASTEEPLTLTPDSLVGSDGANRSLTGDQNLDEHTLGADLPLLAASTQTDLFTDSVSFEVPAGGDGTLYAVVKGYDGCFGVAPYSLRAKVIAAPALPPVPARPAVAAPIATASGPVAISGDPATAETLFITAPSRMNDDSGSDLLGELSSSALSAVIGSTAVLAVDRVPAVAAAFAAMDAEPARLELANDVVREINRAVDDLRGSNPPGYIVVVGGLDVIPMGNVFDPSLGVSERPFSADLATLTDPTAPGNALAVAALRNRILTDDVYLDLAPRRIIGFGHFYEPQIAGARLLETEQEIVGLVSQFVADGGAVDIDSTVSTSSVDFLDDLAAAASAELGALDRVQSDGAVADRTIITEADWGSDGETTLAEAIRPGQVISLHGHSDPVSTQTAGGDRVWVGSSILDGALGSILFSVGCHLQLPLPDGIVRPTTGTEFAQAAAQQRLASSTGNTTYGVGSRSLLAYSEDLMDRFAGQLAQTDVGSALVQAKQSYIDDAGYLDAIDVKILSGANQFGMPHVVVAGVARPVKVDPSPNPVATPSISDFTLTPDLERDETVDGSVFSVAGQTISAPNQPILPAETIETSAQVTGLVLDTLSTFVAEGVGGGPFDEARLVPGRTGGVVLGAEPDPSAGNFPNTLVTPGARGATVSRGFWRGGQNQMTIVSGGSGEVCTGPIDTAPSIEFEEADLIAADGVLAFTAELVSDAAVDVRALYHESGTDGEWSLARLVRVAGPDAEGRQRFSLGIPSDAEEVEAIFQGVVRTGGTCYTADFLEKGFLVNDTDVSDPVPDGITLSMGDGSVEAPANVDRRFDGWWDMARVEIEDTDQRSILYWVDGDAPKPYTGQIQITDEGIHVLSLEIDGQVYSVLVKVDGTGPSVEFAGLRSSYGVGEPARVALSCVDAVSGVASCGPVMVSAPGSAGPVAVLDGQPLPTAAPGTYQVSATAVDTAGNSTTERAAYSVGYVFEGFFAPVVNRPNANEWNPTQNVPLKFKLRRFDGTYETSLSAVTGLGYRTSDDCPGIGGADGPLTSMAGGPLQNTDGQYQFNWKTSASMAGCYSGEVYLADGTSYSALFVFDQKYAKKAL